MKFTVKVYTVIPDETARSYVFMVEADSLDSAQIQLSRKLAHDWIEIPHPSNVNSVISVRTSYIAATEIELLDEPDIPTPVSVEPEPAPVADVAEEAAAETPVETGEDAPVEAISEPAATAE